MMYDYMEESTLKIFFTSKKKKKKNSEFYWHLLRNIDIGLLKTETNCHFKMNQNSNFFLSGGRHYIQNMTYKQKT